jgi:hypothetical protein
MLVKFWSLYMEFLKNSQLKFIKCSCCLHSCNQNDLPVNCLLTEIEFRTFNLNDQLGPFSFGTRTDIYHLLIDGTHEIFCATSAITWWTVCESRPTLPSQYLWSLHQRIKRDLWLSNAVTDALGNTLYKYKSSKGG